EPCESLKATTAFCLGLDNAKVLLSSTQLQNFRAGDALQQEDRRRGVRAAYFVNQSLELAPRAMQRWQIVANLEQSQADVVALRRQLKNPAALCDAIAASIEDGSQGLARIMAGGDAFQATAEESVAVHHYANVLFNILRGGVFNDQYRADSRDFAATVHGFNSVVYRRNQDFLEQLPKRLAFDVLLAAVREQSDPQLERLAYEYLPITFGRRHGDPSRPWNQFAIRLKDEQGNPLLSYEGNWRDIFQNWEALLYSYPDFVENVIAKFVNASTMDGYNPYRITKQGIDWEVEEADNPWSHIGYWGDHQIIYLLKLLELSRDFHPALLQTLLRQPIFCYANVPYRIKSFADSIADPKHTVTYDVALAERIEQRVASIGADGKLLLDESGEVYQVNLLEKLLVPLLSKLGNLVIDGGVWLNTQRPEWNDANNALVGQGLSMVTLYYLRRYVRFLQTLLADDAAAFQLSSDVSRWLAATSSAMTRVRPLLGGTAISAAERYRSLCELGEAASRYRENIYQRASFSDTVEQSTDAVLAMLDDALAAIDHSIGTNRRDDGLYNAYNLLGVAEDSITVDTLYPMLEGQVAALSAGAIAPEDSIAVLEALFDSEVYRPDQKSFMLYPDRPLPGFLDKNRIPADQVEAIPLLRRMLADGDERIIVQDADGCYRFNADFSNVGDLKKLLKSLHADHAEEIEAAHAPLLKLYEQVFRHKSFTGRSGTMFGFEGLGSIYWHMVSKLLLAVQENFFAAANNEASAETLRQLGKLYYRVRDGIGFNKTPAEYGAFPTDPYSHTPKHAGARQPGMTGQVKEEILSRFGELGVLVRGGAARFQPALLRTREFVSEPRAFRYLDVDGEWQTITVPAGGLAFTWCQVPIIYKLDEHAPSGITVSRNDRAPLEIAELTLPDSASNELFGRSGRIQRIEVTLHPDLLFAD
ncbi:MAG: hypothetical protein OEY74_01915, partial [Gammaproteobacteria bacterium]|nr:hypothetical protein [Gammaproteobacteria bacterium]